MAMRMNLLAAAAVAALLASRAVAADIAPYGGPTPSSPDEAYTLTVEGERFPLAGLAEIAQKQADMKTLWDENGVFVGPRLLDVLSAAGVDEFDVLFMKASNGYTVTVQSTDPGIDDALVAHTLNGDLLPLDTKGPFWLVWPSRADAVRSGEDIDSRWIWGVVEIQKGF